MHVNSIRRWAISGLPLAVILCGISQGCQRNEEGVLIKASPEFIAQEKEERAAIEAARMAEKE